MSFHGYMASKKGNRRRVELLGRLGGNRGLSKKKKNILGGNFNFVEQEQDRKPWARDTFIKEKPLREKFATISKDFNLLVSRTLH